LTEAEARTLYKSTLEHYEVDQNFCNISPDPKQNLGFANE